MNILVAPNSFKECIDSVEVAEIVSNELSKTSKFRLYQKPLSDGGDGFLSVINYILEVSSPNVYRTINYSEDLFNLSLTYLEKLKTVYIESAELFGMKTISEFERNPLKLNSELFGRILKFIANQVSEDQLNVQDVYIGVGGTAIIDFGIGACSQLGLVLFDEKGEELIPVPINFNKTNKISFIKKQLPFKIKCVVDVETELIGNPGAIEIYGKQKGATDEDLKLIKNGIENLLQIIPKDLGIKIPEKLNGAGGGLAAGLNLFCDAEIIPAKRFIREKILNDINLDEIDVVITGEGSFDYQSFEGKGSGVILELFKDKQAKIFLINGSTNLDSNYKLPENVHIINLIDFFENKSESIKNIDLGLRKACKIVLHQLSE